MENIQRSRLARAQLVYEGLLTSSNSDINRVLHREVSIINGDDRGDTHYLHDRGNSSTQKAPNHDVSDVAYLKDAFDGSRLSRKTNVGASRLFSSPSMRDDDNSATLQIAENMSVDSLSIGRPVSSHRTRSDRTRSIVKESSDGSSSSSRVKNFSKFTDLGSNSINDGVAKGWIQNERSSSNRRNEKKSYDDTMITIDNMSRNYDYNGNSHTNTNSHQTSGTTAHRTSNYSNDNENHNGSKRDISNYDGNGSNDEIEYDKIKNQDDPTKFSREIDEKDSIIIALQIEIDRLKGRLEVVLGSAEIAVEEVLASQEIVLKDFQNKEKILIKKNNFFEQENIELRLLLAESRRQLGEERCYLSTSIRLIDRIKTNNTRKNKNGKKLIY